MNSKVEHDHIEMPVHDHIEMPVMLSHTYRYEDATQVDDNVAAHISKVEHDDSDDLYREDLHIETPVMLLHLTTTMEPEIKNAAHKRKVEHDEQYGKNARTMKLPPGYREQDEQDGKDCFDGSPLCMPKSTPFATGQVWLQPRKYDWASFGELPTEYARTVILKRTKKMVKFKMFNGHYSDGAIVTAKVKTWTRSDGSTSEYFKTGKGTGTQIFDTANMILEGSE